MRKKFDIKYRPQIESGEYKVETEDGNPVVVMDWDWNHYGKHSIAVKVTCEEKNLGYLYSDNGDPVTLFAPDLFLVTPEPEMIHYIIQRNGIWIPRNEIKRMVEESYKAAIDASKDKDSASQALMLKCEGCAATWEHILSKLPKEASHE